ncbi:hypothetical protein HMPREF1548_03393 [Clostridium sp. KLE 1755]|nr:hypothetical protein HMPREF1548_03393 [Clostridium sp. KLE 1755]
MHSFFWQLFYTLTAASFYRIIHHRYFCNKKVPIYNGKNMAGKLY